jgi:VCBS repeat-containing protein
MRKLIAITTSIAVAGLVNIVSVSAVRASSAEYTLPADSTYVEDSGAVQILPGFTITDASQTYGGGSVTFSLSEAYEAGETLAISETSFDDSGNTITYSGGTVFKSGTAVGNIDGVEDGAESDLTINFSNSFTNGSFDNGSSDGWSIGSSRVNLGYVDDSGTVIPSTSTIAEFTPPVDYIWPDNANSGDRNVGDLQQWDRADDLGRFTYSGTTATNKLVAGMDSKSCAVDGCILRGPAVVSESSVYVAAGNTISFDWSASGPDDDFDVFAYLVKVSGDQAGRAFKLLDATGRSGSGAVSITVGGEGVGSVHSSSTLFSSYTQSSYTYGLLNSAPGNERADWSRIPTGLISGTSSADRLVGAKSTEHYSADSFIDDNDPSTDETFIAGQYKFVFVPGTYDASFGKLTGATFTIDNIAVSGGGGVSVEPEDVRDLARLLTYSNTTGLAATRTLRFSSINSLGGSDTADSTRGASKIITIDQVNGVPDLDDVTTATFVDTSGDDLFTSPSISGSLSATDEEGESLTYGISGVTPVSGVSSKTGNFGVLTVNDDGTYSYAPDAVAMNALDSSSSDVFTITASDGSATGTATFTVPITAVVDTRPGPPRITSVTPGDRQLTVAFTSPLSSGTSPLENYEYSTDGTNYIALPTPQTSSPIVIRFLSTGGGSTPLSNGTSYDISIKAVNATTSSIASNLLSGTPRLAPAPSPGGSAPAATPAVPTPTPTVTPRPRRVGPAPIDPSVLFEPFLQGPVPSPPPLAPTGRVGGLLVPIQTQVTSPTGFSLRAGVLNLGLEVQQDQGVVRQNNTGGTEIEVRKGSTTALTGSGLLPRSTVQVFLPLQGPNAKEIARIPVDDTGAFSGDAVFATRANERPLPIGRQLLQVVSLDEDGQQAVVEMTINIAQGAPAPELDRTVGEVPTLRPGQSIATNAGEPEVVQVSANPDTKSATVEGDGWTMAVNIGGARGEVSESSEGGALLQFVRDEGITITGGGFMPGTRADVWLFSDPTLLGTVDIDENGELEGNLMIDGSAVPVGDHTLQMQGVGEDGYVRSANLGVTVSDAVVDVTTEEAAGGLLWWLIGLIAVIGLAAALTIWQIRSRRA